MNDLGEIVKGSGTTAKCHSKVAYFVAKRATYKARIKDGKVEFVRFATIKKLLNNKEPKCMSQVDKEPNPEQNLQGG